MFRIRMLWAAAAMTVAATACNRSDDHPATTAAKNPPAVSADASPTIIVPPPAPAPGQAAAPTGTPGQTASSAASGVTPGTPGSTASSAGTPAGTPGPAASASGTTTVTPGPSASAAGTSAGTPGNLADSSTPGATTGTPGSFSGGSAGNTASGTTTPGPSAAASPDTAGTSAPPAGAAGPVAGSDRYFVSEAINNALAEIDAGRMVAAKTTDPTIKSFAQQLERDHASTSEELKRIAGQKGIGLPTTVAGEPRSQLSKLSSLTGSRELERDFVQEFGINAHQQAISLFEREAREGQDPELKAFAERTLPRLREHLGMAQQLQTGRTSAPGGQ